MSEVLEESANAPKKVISLVFNRIDIPRTLLPFKIGQTCHFDVATSEEKSTFKNMLEYSMPPRSLTSAFEIFEGNGSITITGDNGKIKSFSLLPESDHHYYVFRTNSNEDQNNVLQRIHFAASISICPLYITELYFGNNYQALRPCRLGGFQPDFFEERRTISQVELKDIEKNYYSLENTANNSPTEYVNIENALNMLDDLRNLPRGSKFEVLGLFAIIEMLITHNPKLEDKGDSITHQMRSKIPLLANRFENPLEYTKYFAATKIDAIWSQLYAYRSSVAHGGSVDFKGKLQALTSAENANKFLYSVVRSLIRHATTEPQLYTDIRNC